MQNSQSKETKKSAFTILWNSIPFFRNLSLPQFTEISREFKVLKFKAGTNIIQQGEPVEWLGIVLFGNMLVKCREQVFETLRPGDIIGHMGIAGLYNNDEYKFTITANDNGYIAIITAQDIKALLRTKPLIVTSFE